MNTQAVDDAYVAIDAYLEGQMRRLKIPGVAVAVVEGDRIVYQRGYGLVRPGGAAPTPQTPFVLGSTTKSFTALAVMQLVEAGRVELDAPVQRYLPWFRVADQEASVHMTVRHLLNQTSGLPMLPGMILLADLDDRPDACERQARTLATIKLSRRPGAAFEYSNLNFNLLGLIVEAASGESYADYVQRHIFDPLDMRHSYTSLAPARRDGLAVGHRYWFAHPFPIHDLPIPRGSLPSGQLISTAEDMAHYLIAQLNGGRYGDTQVLSGAGIDELHRSVVDVRVMGQVVDTYAMGWFASEIGPAKLVWHGGNVPDFSSYMALLPAQQTGMVLLVNADHYGLPFVLPEVGHGIAALLTGQEPPPVRLGFLPWVMRALLLIPLLQIAGIVTSLGLLRRWQQTPARRPSDGRVWERHVLLPLIPSLSLAALTLFLRRQGLLPYLRLYNPDLFWIVRLCGSFAGMWAVLRSGLLLRALRRPTPARLEEYIDP